MPEWNAPDRWWAALKKPALWHRRCRAMDGWWHCVRWDSIEFLSRWHQINSGIFILPAGTLMILNRPRPPKATTDINHDFVPPQARNGNAVLCTDEQQVFHSSVSSSSGWNFPTPTPSIMHGWINRYRFGVIFRFMRTATLPACSLMDEENSWQRIEGQRGRRWEHSYFGFLY